MKRHPISITTWRMWCKLKDKYRNLWQTPKESKCVGSLSQTLTGVKKGRARDSFHAACVGGLGFFSQRILTQPWGEILWCWKLWGVLTSNFWLLLLAPIILGSYLPREWLSPAGKLSSSVSNTPGAHMASEEIHLLKCRQRGEFSWNLL